MPASYDPRWEPARYAGHEESTTTTRTTRQVPLPGAALPEGVHIQNARRASDEERDRFIVHLQDMHSQGLMDDAELAARVEAAQAAVVTDTHLKPLISDLPPLPVTKRTLRQAQEPFSWHKFLREQSHPLFALQVASVLFSAAWIIVPWLFVNSHSAPGTVSLAVISTLAGVAGVIAVIVWLISVWDA